MKILAFAGSSSSTSINKSLVEWVLKSFPEAEINLLDLNDFEMPIFSVDQEKKGFPPQAQEFIDGITQSDAIICSMAEHNKNFTVAFKNIFDWCSRINVKLFQNKKMFLMSTSPGGYGGGNVMNIAKTTFPSFGAEVVETFSLPQYYENFDLENGVINKELANELTEKLAKFKTTLEG